MAKRRSIDLILVPQGAEYQAVMRGLKPSLESGETRLNQPTVVAIPAGVAPVQQFLQMPPYPTLLQQKSILVLGLCGSLRSQLEIGQAVLYQSCRNALQQYDLSAWLGDLTSDLTLVQAITTDRVIHRVADKQELAQTYDVDVVDMEGTAILQALGNTTATTTMIRVVSDTMSHDLPDLSRVFDTAGNLQPGALAIALLRHPIAALHLIRGSMIGLQQLEALVARLVAEGFEPSR